MLHRRGLARIEAIRAEIVACWCEGISYRARWS